MPLGPVGRGWITAFDFDFTAQTTQTLGSDGNFNVGGYQWNKSNSANDASAMVVTNGTGLVVQPVANTNYNGSTRTLPALWLPFAQVPALSQLDSSSALRIWAHIASFNGAASFDDAVLAIDSNTLGAMAHQGLRGWGLSGNPGFSGQQQINGNSITGSSTFVSGNTIAFGGTSNVLVIEVDKLMFGTMKVSGGGYGLASGKTWPDASNLILWATSIPNTNAYNSFLPASAIPYNVILQQLGVTLGARRSNSGTALNTTFGHLRIDYKN